MADSTEYLKEIAENTSHSNSNNKASESLYFQVQNASDLIKTFNYADAGTPDERITSITSASSSVEANFTDTYIYSGTSGSYRITRIERTQNA